MSHAKLASPPDLRSRLQRAEDRGAFLRDVSLFAEIRDVPSAMEDLSAAMSLQCFDPGANILREGESGAEMYLLISGQASIYKSTGEGELYKVAIISGENHPFFGEGGLLDSEARSATIRADSVCYCLVLDRGSFEEFGRRHPQWALPVLSRIARVVMARVHKSNHDLTLLYNALVAEIRGS